MSPAWKVGARNTADQLPRIAATLAELRAMPVDHLYAAATANALAVLPGLARFIHCH
jgi:TatD DNase family protein